MPELHCPMTAEELVRTCNRRIEQRCKHCGWKLLRHTKNGFEFCENDNCIENLPMFEYEP